jgi:hypothetical protein
MVEPDSFPGPPEGGRDAVTGTAEPRCANCGGLLARGAEWCGQCFAPVATGPTPLAAPSPSAGSVDRRPAAAAGLGGGAVEVAAGKATWECPVCGVRNPIEADRCPACQTPFGRLFETAEERPRIEPRTAMLWSLVLPGLGHWKVGLRADAVARMVLFAWTLGTVLVVVASRAGSGFGSSTSLFVLYLGSATGIYVLSAIDAARAADGRPPVVSSRVLLWASAALVLASIALATLVTLPAARG